MSSRSNRKNGRNKMIMVNRTSRGVEKYKSVPGLFSIEPNSKRDEENGEEEEEEDSLIFPDGAEDGDTGGDSEDEHDTMYVEPGSRMDRHEVTCGGAVPLVWQVKIDGADQFFLNPNMKENGAEFLRLWLCDQPLFGDRSKTPTLQNPSIGSILAKWVIDSERSKKNHRKGTGKRGVVKKPRRNLKRTIGDLGSYRKGSSFSEVKPPLRDAVLSGRSKAIYE